MSMALKPPYRMTVTEFLAWDAPGQIRWQLVDGEPIAMTGTGRRHRR
jgi:Uma2 family endonuclease